MKLHKPTDVIPPGSYCYEFVKERARSKDQIVPPSRVCPYWSRRSDKLSQEDGYCSFIEMGDWEDNEVSLLWDMVKECGINDDSEADYDHLAS